VSQKNEKVLIVIPTYNERKNIAALIPEIRKFLPQAHILVVDDNSPDKTANTVKTIMHHDKRVALISRSAKLGLGTAYVEGFKYALAHKYDYIFEMDADFSHDPKYLPEFMQEIKTHDLVIGSRYVNGISVVNWPMRRLMLSKFATFYVRLITGLPLTDCTSGFKCYRSKVLKAIDLNEIHSDGYAFQVEMHYKAWKRKFKLKEIPVIFIDRHAGSSKMSRNIAAEAVTLVWKLRLGIVK